MAITILEQLSILDGTVAPESYTWDRIITQSAIAKSSAFVNEVKSIDSSDDEALTYALKMKAKCTDILSNPNRHSKQLASILISLYTGTYSAVQSANDTAWASFTESHMEDAIEALAGVSSIEKLAYDNH